MLLFPFVLKTRGIYWLALQKLVESHWDRDEELQIVVLKAAIFYS